ncbi:MAG TPA: metallopeptidase family protein [Firmicutes bacterium]|nr:metallopeptidase family protein [Bacillota bacterium]
MILSFDEVGEILDEMAETFPEVFYRDLNGGISLLPEAVEDPEFPPGEIYIMGEYCNDQMGLYINLYYGSFAALAEKEDWTREDWEDELYTTLAHEFTHHIEGLALENGLDRKDEQELAEFRAYYREHYGKDES